MVVALVELVDNSVGGGGLSVGLCSSAYVANFGLFLYTFGRDVSTPSVGLL